MKDAVVEIKDLYVGFKTFKGYTKVLNGVNLSVNKGERISIVGETGCGKTTTVKSILQILAKQAKIEKGQILFQGKNLLKMTIRFLLLVSNYQLLSSILGLKEQIDRRHKKNWPSKH